LGYVGAKLKKVKKKGGAAGEKLSSGGKEVSPLDKGKNNEKWGAGRCLRKKGGLWVSSFRGCKSEGGPEPKGGTRIQGAA